MSLSDHENISAGLLAAVVVGAVLGLAFAIPALADLEDGTVATTHTTFPPDANTMVLFYVRTAELETPCVNKPDLKLTIQQRDQGDAMHDLHVILHPDALPASIHLLDNKVAHITDYETDGSTYTGEGVAHNRSPACREHPSLFEFQFAGHCDGSTFNFTSGAYNATAREDHVQAWCGVIP